MFTRAVFSATIFAALNAGLGVEAAATPARKGPIEGETATLVPDNNGRIGANNLTQPKKTVCDKVSKKVKIAGIALALGINKDMERAKIAGMALALGINKDVERAKKFVEQKLCFSAEQATKFVEQAKNSKFGEQAKKAYNNFISPLMFPCATASFLLAVRASKLQNTLAEAGLQ